MEFRILGPLEVRDGEESVPLGPAKEQALLAVLLLQASAVVSRERLIGELWGESPPPTAAKALNVHVSQLRKRLAPDSDGSIVTRPPGYALVVDPERVDSTRFERLVAEAHDYVAAGDAASAGRLLRDALSLWRGPALDGIELEANARNEVGRLEHLRLAAQMDRTDCDLALGLHEQVIGELSSLVGEHPLRERLHGQLILALYRAGRQADALQAYREAREKLVSELGIEPSTALQRLERGILNHDPALEAPAGVARTDRPPTSTPALPRRRRRSKRARLGAAAVVGIAAAGVAAVLSTSAHGHVTVVPNSLVQVAADGQLATVTRVGTLPAALASEGGSIWTLNQQDGTVSRVDAHSGKLDRTFSVRGAPIDIAAGENAVWVIAEVSGRGAVERVDPGSGAIRWTSSFASLTPRAIAAGEGGIWVAAENGRGSGGVLLRVSPRTGRVARTIRLPSKPTDVAVGADAVWVLALLPPAPGLSATAGAIYLVDPASGSIAARTTATFVPGRGASSIAVGPDSSGWVAGGLGALAGLDPFSADVTQRIQVPPPVVGVAFSGGALWALSGSGVLSRLDVDTGRVVGRTPIGTSTARATAIVANSGRLWVAFKRASDTPVGAITAPAQTSIAVGNGPTRARFGAGSVWVKNLDRRLSRIDPRTGRVTATIPIGTGWGDVGFGFGSVWATSFDDNLIARIDPRTNRVLARIPSHGVAPLGVAITRDAVWVANHHADTRGTGSIVRIDPRTNRIVARIPLGAETFCCGPDNMTVAAGDVWVDIPNEELVVRIDARRNRVSARIQVPTGCGQLAAGAGAVWIADGCSAQVLRIDPRTNRVVHRIDTGSANVYPIAFSHGSIWTTTDDLRLLRIDPATNTIIDTRDVAPATRPNEQGPWFAVGAGAVWLTDYPGNRVLRVALPR